MADASSLATVASLIATFGVAMLLFRIQRELKMQADGERNWIPWSDWLLVTATLVSLFLVILPMLSLRGQGSRWALLPPSAAATASFLVAAYIPAILAHYRLILGRGRVGPRENPEPGERLVVKVSIIVSALGGVAVFLIRSR